MGDIALWVLIAAAIAIGWLLGRHDRRSSQQDDSVFNPDIPYANLQWILNSPDDKALDTFIHNVEVSLETLSMHLTLGAQFRKKGEVEKAIRVHQNLLAQPDIPAAETGKVTLELARDYMSAGLLDRAETLLKELVEKSPHFSESASFELIHLFEQEKDWGSAEAVIERLGTKRYPELKINLSHYACEQAERAIGRKETAEARQWVAKALVQDKSSVRAGLLSAQLAIDGGEYREAVAVLRRCVSFDKGYLHEVIPLLFRCAQQLGTEAKLRDYLGGFVDSEPMSSLIIAIADCMREVDGKQAAVEFLKAQLEQKPSLRTLCRLTELQLEAATEADRSHWLIIHRVITELLADKPVYQCIQCGFSGRTLHWLCPSCHAWGAVKPIKGIEGE